MAAKAKTPDNSPLSFSFSAHLLEDLGVNLYTSLSKALVEFVANAYDADSPHINVTFDAPAIRRAREVCKEDFDEEVKAAKKKGNAKGVVPLEHRTLPETVSIVIEDSGHGMTKNELQEKFLVIGRRRREGKSPTERSRKKKRLIMGRKGLGKLAGFGMAHKIVILSRAEKTSYTTRITLDYSNIIASSPESPTETSKASVPTEILEKGGLLKSGTRIILSKLVYQTAKSADQSSVSEALARHFGMLLTADFKIKVNGKPAKPPARKYAYSYPDDGARAKHALVSDSIVDSESGVTYSFSYRLRFTEKKGYLPAMERGLRVYAHNRLAVMPTMLDVNSNAHGFRFSDYLDGVVIADFVDELPVDVIATDRSDLRWEVHPLADLREFLTKQMTKALGVYADLKANKDKERVRSDTFTKRVIDEADLPEHQRKTAMQFAESLAASESDGVDSAYYQNTLGEVVGALGHGRILTVIKNLADEDRPDLAQLVNELTNLTHMEFDEFIRVAQIRIKGIEGLAKIVKAVDFKKAKNERELHRLFQRNPWLINPTFFEFLLSDEEEDVLAGRLAKHLGIGKAVPADYDPSAPEETNPLGSNKRPDLVTLLANEQLYKIVIVELKAPNTPLHFDHFVQLTDYMRHVREWLEAKDKKNVERYTVIGYLIGSKPESSVKGGEKISRFLDLTSDAKRPKDVHVMDIMDVLKTTELVHRDLLEAVRKAKGSGTRIEAANSALTK